MSGSDGDQGLGPSGHGLIDSNLICATPRTGSSLLCGLLEFLGLERPPGIEIRAGHRQLADRLNAEWVQRYRTGRGD